MFPIRDNVPSRTTPFINYLMIALCSLTFYAQLTQSRDGSAYVEEFGMIPARVLNPDRPIEIVRSVPVRTVFGTTLRQERHPVAPSAVPPWLTLLTCIFLHGGWMHIIGNMWFLFIFGDNVEDRMGHLGYLLFYLFCGLVASVTHLVTNAQSTVPTIGASGAVAGVMGAYFVLYPRARVLMVVPIFFFLEMVVVPAPLFLGVWFLMQFLQGTMTITAVQQTGVAWWAHIGGFMAGFVMAWVLKVRDWMKPSVQTVRPNTDRMTHYRIRPYSRYGRN